VSDLADLIRQRDALSAQIDAATKTRDEAYADGLDALQEVVDRFAGESGLEVTTGVRKNVQMLTLGGWLAIQFGYPREGYSAHLVIQTAGGITAEWRDELPPATAFAGYLRGLVEYDRTSQEGS
jgi:hypothetical protein